VGTFGTGAFSSDGAMDFLDDLAERPPERRTAALEHMFTFVENNPDRIWRDFFPDQIVAAAAIIAAPLPGVNQFNERLKYLIDNGLAPDVRLSVPALHLAEPALKALLLVARPDGPWHQNWVTEADAVDARETTDTLLRVLRDAASQS
jgi:alpha-glucosidase